MLFACFISKKNISQSYISTASPESVGIVMRLAVYMCVYLFIFLGIVVWYSFYTTPADQGSSIWLTNQKDDIPRPACFIDRFKDS